MRPRLWLHSALLGCLCVQVALCKWTTDPQGKCATRSLAPGAAPSPAAPLASPPAASGSAFLAAAPEGSASPASTLSAQSLTPVQQEQGDYYDYELPSKQSWPELVGTNAQSAQKVIKASPGVKSVILVQMGEATTDDFVPTRVRVYYAPRTDKVAQTPKIG